jgi:hypothetical protein
MPPNLIRSNRFEGIPEPVRWTVLPTGASVGDQRNRFPRREATSAFCAEAPRRKTLTTLRPPLRVTTLNRFRRRAGTVNDATKDPLLLDRVLTRIVLPRRTVTLSRFPKWRPSRETVAPGGPEAGAIVTLLSASAEVGSNPRLPPIKAAAMKPLALHRCSMPSMTEDRP